MTFIVKTANNPYCRDYKQGRTMIYKNGFIFLCVLLFSIQGFAGETDGLDFSGQWFIAYDYEKEDGQESNEFGLKRGYVTVQKTLNQYLSIRVTQDIAVDQEGDGVGDVEIRLKYGYLKYSLPDFSFFHKPYIEFGLVHRPWIDFEQSINKYRVQGTMFMERYGLLRSADYGFTMFSYFGGSMDKEYLDKINKKFGGKYGSLSVGLFNGGGYEEIEENENKLVEGRLTVRPLPATLPGFQFSYIGAFGKGNTAESPDFNLNAVFLSYEQENLIATAMYYNGLGGLQGEIVYVNTGKSVQQSGYSLFGEIKIPFTALFAFGRFDNFKNELYDLDYNKRRFMGGFSYPFHKGSKLVLDYDYLDNEEPGKQNEWVFEIALEFSY